MIVDEYQDINPAQERLIELLTTPGVELCVVGDDQQAIYQWRGSNVSNIVTFVQRYPSVATFAITTNRRSRPQLIEVANRFSESIPERIKKVMLPDRPPAGRHPEIVVWSEASEVDEAGRITRLIDELIQDGVEPRDIAVLVRSRASYARLTEQLATLRHPGPAWRKDRAVRPAGSTRARHDYRLARRHGLAGALPAGSTADRRRCAPARAMGAAPRL